MIVQALWEYKSPLLQLPHITEDNLKHFSSRKKHVQTLQQLAQMPDDERRQTLKSLNDDQYDDLIRVLSNMPYIHFKVNTEGIMIIQDIFCNMVYVYLTEIFFSCR